MRFARKLIGRRQRSADPIAARPGDRPEEPPTLTVLAGGEDRRVTLRRSDRARRMTLRIDARRGGAVLSVPQHVPVADAQRFLQDHADWLGVRLSSMPTAVPFADDGVFPLRGSAVRIVHRPGRGTVKFQDFDGERLIIVHGRTEHTARRIEDWLKSEARQDLTRAVDRHAAALNVKPAAIRVRDTGTRWGSCSSRKTLSFSWRLILAPPNVLNYLAAHEVAHLRQMNHSADFWNLVTQLDPHYRDAQAWLKEKGPALFAYGRRQTSPGRQLPEPVDE